MQEVFVRSRLALVLQCRQSDVESMASLRYIRLFHGEDPLRHWQQLDRTVAAGIVDIRLQQAAKLVAVEEVEGAEGSYRRLTPSRYQWSTIAR